MWCPACNSEEQTETGCYRPSFTSAWDLTPSKNSAPSSIPEFILILWIGELQALRASSQPGAPPKIINGQGAAVLSLCLLNFSCARYRDLFKDHPLNNSIQNQYSFLTQVFGGPHLYNDLKGRACIRGMIRGDSSLCTPREPYQAKLCRIIPVANPVQVQLGTARTPGRECAWRHVCATSDLASEHANVLAR
jgi:hypothetical protein